MVLHHTAKLYQKHELLHKLTSCNNMLPL